MLRWVFGKNAYSRDARSSFFQLLVLIGKEHVGAPVFLNLFVY
jgi:hypothetical protein